jgi:hypothetical protein
VWITSSRYAKPRASKPITTKYLVYTLADQHQLTKTEGQQMLMGT